MFIITDTLTGLQDRCGNVFAQLANASCVMEQEDTKRELGQRSMEKIPAVLQTKPKLPRLHAAHALSIDVILSIGLEMGSHSADCWQHVFRLFVIFVFCHLCKSIINRKNSVLFFLQLTAIFQFLPTKSR